jgi:signal peptidase I
MLRQKEPWRRVLPIALAAGLGIAAGHTVIQSWGSISVIDGESMEPTYEPGARVYTAPISSPLERGDIVMIDDGRKDYAIKRLIALPGETVELWRGYVFINRKLLKEPYLPKYTYTFPDQRTEEYIFRLDADEYFVLGDNRPSSADSRVYGPVHRKQIKSRVPLPEHVLRGAFAAYTLPEQGKRGIRPSE